MGLQKTPVVEPIDPFQRGELHGSKFRHGPRLWMTSALPAKVDGPPIMKCLIEGFEHKARMGGPACPPTDDTPSKRVNDESHVDEALPGRHMGEIRKPEHVRRGREEVPVHPVERTWGGLVRHGNSCVSFRHTTSAPFVRRSAGDLSVYLCLGRRRHRHSPRLSPLDCRRAPRA